MQRKFDLHKLGDYLSGKLYIITAFLKNLAKLENADREIYLLVLSMRRISSLGSEKG